MKMDDNPLKFRSGAALTRDGTAALIYCADAPGEHSLHGRVAGMGHVTSWRADGRYLPDRESVLDLRPNSQESAA